MPYPGEIVNYAGVVVGRDFREEVLDLDKSPNAPARIINQFRWVRFCGKLMQQTSCNVWTGEASFTPCE